MSNYVMSDIHGCYDDFIKMLELIQFKDNDDLHILGDIIDRGNKSIEMVDYVISHKNIHLLRGNHEQMYIDYYEDNDTSLWYNNGGVETHIQMMSRPYIYEESLYKYFKKLPLIEIVDKFILVHAGLYFPKNYSDLELDSLLQEQEDDICLWSRDSIGKEKQYKDYTMICGHTPVQTITGDCKEVKILKRNGTIYIDCGCVYKTANGKLACLRLDDMAEFYV